MERTHKEIYKMILNGELDREKEYFELENKKEIDIKWIKRHQQAIKLGEWYAYRNIRYMIGEPNGNIDK